MLNILVSVPNGTGWLHKHIVFVLLQMQEYKKANVTIMLPTHSPYINNLHKTMWNFLEGDYDFWITMDDDNPPRVGSRVLDLCFLNKDVIGCPTPVWANMKEGDYPIYWNALDEVEDGFKPHENRQGLQKVDVVGSGCLVIKKEVMWQLKFEEPFMRKWGKNGVVSQGGDFSFCQKVRKKGFEVWAHFGYPCFHFNEIEIGEIQLAFENLRK